MRYLKSLTLYLLTHLPRPVLKMLSIQNQHQLAKWTELHYARKL